MSAASAGRDSPHCRHYFTSFICGRTRENNRQFRRHSRLCIVRPRQRLTLGKHDTTPLPPAYSILTSRLHAVTIFFTPTLYSHTYRRSSPVIRLFRFDAAKCVAYFAAKRRYQPTPGRTTSHFAKRSEALGGFIIHEAAAVSTLALFRYRTPRGRPMSSTLFRTALSRGHRVAAYRHLTGTLAAYRPPVLNCYHVYAEK
jgi:hypothetical protein